ncbi:glia maturation factor gamma isoform X5 [Sapajus apella]|uniref:Glia maturation factor gamma isoform X5 n=1 Tax=Sapajus apella TaxID=9515 RepID=A0A6J3FG80_SAPAP|nr:glia maturation factor gamma isoform X5 [Sapajus apella]
MSDSLVVCEVDPELREKLRKFRFRKETDNAAIIMKVDKDRQMVVLEEEFQNISPDELKMELPERQPRCLKSAPLMTSPRPGSKKSCLSFVDLWAET